MTNTPEQLAAEIETNTHGHTEWRVQDPADGSYCISFGSESFRPEQEAREWLADHIKRNPSSQFAGYEVVKVHYYTAAQQMALDAAAMLRTLSTQVEQLTREKAAWIEQHGRDSAELRRLCQARDDETKARKAAQEALYAERERCTEAVKAEQRKHSATLAELAALREQGQWRPVTEVPDGDVWFALDCGHVVAGYKSGPLIDWSQDSDSECCFDAAAVAARPYIAPAHPSPTSVED